MRGLLLTCLSILLLAAACSGSGTAKDVASSLRITVWPDGQAAGKPVERWRLSCNPLGGSVPHGDRACYLLATLSRPFAPVPPDVACAEVYGGPQVAHVVGSVRGRRVDATFRRTDGCQIARWNRVDFLFPKRP